VEKPDDVDAVVPRGLEHRIGRRKVLRTAPEVRLHGLAIEPQTGINEGESVGIFIHRPEYRRYGAVAFEDVGNLCASSPPRLFQRRVRRPELRMRGHIRVWTRAVGQQPLRKPGVVVLDSNSQQEVRARAVATHAQHVPVRILPL
jgi:hypothetical protein